MTPAQRLQARERFLRQRTAASRRSMEYEMRVNDERSWQKELRDSGYGRDNSPGSACGPPAPLPAFSFATGSFSNVYGFVRWHEHHRYVYRELFGWAPGAIP